MLLRNMCHKFDSPSSSINMINSEKNIFEELLTLYSLSKHDRYDSQLLLETRFWERFNRNMTDRLNYRNLKSFELVVFDISTAIVEILYFLLRQRSNLKIWYEECYNKLNAWSRVSMTIKNPRRKSWRDKENKFHRLDQENRFNRYLVVGDI